jgi:hypothetical protein
LKAEAQQKKVENSQLSEKRMVCKGMAKKGVEISKKHCKLGDSEIDKTSLITAYLGPPQVFLQDSFLWTKHLRPL